VALGAVFAAHAAVAMIGARREASLERKSDSRELIGRAKGILMAPHRITDDEAFGRLRQASQHLNVKLTRVAEDVTLTGEVPRS
jgi:AmiR/NasT family two-component response regulator